MPCCGGRSTSRATNSGLPGAPRLNQTGVIELASLADCTDPDCLAPYSGVHRHATAYIVGWNTEHERLFKANEGKAAAAWASHLGDGVLKNDRIILAELSVRAVEELLAR